MEDSSGTRMKLPGVTAVISTHNRRSEVATTLKNLEACRYPGLEVLVVDNASTDGTGAMVGEAFPEARVIRQEKNDPLPGYNLGFRAAGTPYILALDDDSSPLPGVLEMMVETMEEHSDAGLAAANIVSPGGESEWGTFSDLSLTVDWYNVIGCGFLARTRVLREAAGYSEQFGLYYNDLDLALRILALGYRIAYCGEWVVEHRKARANRISRLKTRMMFRNFPLLVRSHFSGLRAADLILGHTLMMVPLALREKCLLSGVRSWCEGLAGPTGRSCLGLPDSPARRAFVRDFALSSRRPSRKTIPPGLQRRPAE